MNFKGDSQLENRLTNQQLQAMLGCLFVSFVSDVKISKTTARDSRFRASFSPLRRLVRVPTCGVRRLPSQTQRHCYKSCEHHRHARDCERNKDNPRWQDSEPLSTNSLRVRRLVPAEVLCRFACCRVIVFRYHSGRLCRRSAIYLRAWTRRRCSSRLRAGCFL